MRELGKLLLGLAEGALTMGTSTSTRCSSRLQRWWQGRLDEERRWRDRESGDGCVCGVVVEGKVGKRGRAYGIWQRRMKAGMKLEEGLGVRMKLEVGVRMKL